ncbi:transmembrane protein 18 [Cladochytrium replicatum]|nr:transmembrane protein 18 [Cladochytrium replicatum]
MVNIVNNPSELSKIDFTEPFIQALFAFHTIVLVWVISTRKSSTLLSVNLCLLALGGLLSEQLNNLAGRHWKTFSKTNYFDKSGVFTTTLWSAPLIAIMLLNLVFLLNVTMNVLAVTKRAQLKEAARKAKKTK